MKKKRKIALVVSKGSFSQVDELEDKYWAEKSFEERLQALKEMRFVFFGTEIIRMKRVVRKYKLNEEGI